MSHIITVSKLQAMVVIGTGGHAKEILDVIINHSDSKKDRLAFFDDFNIHDSRNIFGNFELITSKDLLKQYFETISPFFVLGIGKPALRKKIAAECRAIGGILTSAISTTSIIGTYNVSFSAGLNIMHRTLISNCVNVGEGALINAGSQIHHDTVIEPYCEVAPCAVILGGGVIKQESFIGSGAVILPNIVVGENSIIGAGAVVTKNVKPNSKLLGIPAK